MHRTRSSPGKHREQMILIPRNLPQPHGEFGLPHPLLADRASKTGKGSDQNRTRQERFVSDLSKSSESPVRYTRRAVGRSELRRALQLP